MKVKIDELGILFLGRRGRLEMQSCPTAQWYDDDDQVYRQECCGDHCPLFGEPEERNGYIAIQLCHGVLLQIKPAEFTDEREEADKCLQS